MQRGRQRYEVYCAACHGLTGEGNGLTALRAMELQQPTWIPPTSLHVEPVVQQPVGQLFQTISYGVRKMPAYQYQIPPEDRWAIVLYVRALQRSQNATLSDVPQELQNSLRETN
jgi:mono/diheme cytochrome c family protein